MVDLIILFFAVIAVGNTFRILKKSENKSFCKFCPLKGSCDNNRDI